MWANNYVEHSSLLIKLSGSRLVVVNEVRCANMLWSKIWLPFWFSSYYCVSSVLWCMYKSCMREISGHHRSDEMKVVVCVRTRKEWLQISNSPESSCSHPSSCPTPLLSTPWAPPPAWHHTSLVASSSPSLLVTPPAPPSCMRTCNYEEGRGEQRGVCKGTRAVVQGTSLWLLLYGAA